MWTPLLLERQKEQAKFQFTIEDMIAIYEAGKEHYLGSYTNIFVRHICTYQDLTVKISMIYQKVCGKF